MPPPAFKPLMSPKIDRVLTLAADGKSVEVAGPAATWDPATAAAVYTAVVSQDVGDGSEPAMVTSIGWSMRYDPPGNPPPADPRWGLTARVVGTTALESGGATCAAWALYADTDGGSWVYEWRLPVRLVKQIPPR